MLRFTVLMVALAILLTGGCGKKETSQAEFSTADYLPESFTGSPLERNSDVRLFEGDALYEHINGGAEVFHLYQFVDVATAYYQAEEVELLADVYRFADSDNAFGLFSSLRNEEAEMIDIGIQGSVTDGRLDCVKGDCVISITAYDVSEQTDHLMRTLARGMVRHITGADNLPAVFGRMPSWGALPYTESMVAQAYLGQGFLDHVYTRRHLVGTDTVTFFLTADPDGAMLATWAEAYPGEGDNPGFEAGPWVDWDNSYYGRIVAGRKGDDLIGIIGYAESTREAFVRWLEAGQ